VTICDACGKSFVPKYKRKDRPGRYCSLDCYYSVGPRGQRKAVVNGPRMTSRPDLPIAPPSGILAYSRVILYELIGPGPHECHWCYKEINWKQGLLPDALIVDHLDHNEQNNSPENLVESCLSCNAHRRIDGSAAIIKDGELTLEMNKGRTRAVERVCLTCGETFLALPANVKRGGGRYCSRDCVYRRNVS